MLFRTLSAEMLKLRRTLALWMVLVAPAVVVMLTFMMTLNRSAYFIKGKEDPWYLLARSVFILWGFIMLPLFVTLESALLGGLEHGERQWHNLLALPVPRWTVFLSKLVVLGVVVVAVHVLLFSGAVLCGLALGVLKPSLRLGWPVSWRVLAEFTVWTLAATPLLLSIHHWVSMRWRNFTVAVGFGMCVVAGGFIISQSDRWWWFYPWSWPVRASMEHPAGIVIAACGMAIAAAAASCWDLSRRDVS